MKIDIEQYKGQSIFYDEDSDKFLCDITIEDKYKSTKRQSLKDVRKEIDVFVKMNLEFKPFKCILKSSYYESFKITNIEAIRTDGTLLERENANSSGNILNKNDFIRICSFDEGIINGLETHEAEYRKAYNSYKAKEKELYKSLTPVDLSKYDAILTKTV